MSGKENGRLRFAVMCNSLVLQQWQTEALNRLLESGQADLVLFIVRRRSETNVQGFFRKLFQYKWTKVLFRQYYRYLFHPGAFRASSIAMLAEEVPVIYCDPEIRKKYSEYFSEDDLNSIKGFSPDFILKFGFGIVRGAVLQAAPYGIWSFHHGDEQKYRGVPPAFHEILFGDRIS